MAFKRCPGCASAFSKRGGCRETIWAGCCRSAVHRTTLQTDGLCCACPCESSWWSWYSPRWDREGNTKGPCPGQCFVMLISREGRRAHRFGEQMRGGGRSKSRSLTSDRLLAPGRLYLRSKQLTVSCKSSCVIEGRMTRYLGPERLITPGGWGGSWYKEGRQKESKPVNDNIYKALERRDPKFYLGISAQEIKRTKFENVLYSNQSDFAFGKDRLKPIFYWFKNINSRAALSKQY